jgi:predicted DNA-binding protein (MmcQ/YjbR family)
MRKTNDVACGQCRVKCTEVSELPCYRRGRPLKQARKLFDLGVACLSATKRDSAIEFKRQYEIVSRPERAVIKRATFHLASRHWKNRTLDESLRTDSADNLKRELPRIPFAPDFKAFAAAGKKLAEWHLGYEGIEPYKLKFLEADGVPLSYRVEKMKLSKDKTELRVNDSLALAGIPPAVFEYRLGNRSALDWVIDQYRVTEDERSGIKSDPNREDDEEYIVRLVGQVVKVSVETVKIVKALPEEYTTPGEP